MGALCQSNNSGASDVPKSSTALVAVPVVTKKHVNKEMGDERKQELKAAFAKLDKIQDGHLTRAEMIRVSEQSPDIATILGLP